MINKSTYSYLILVILLVIAIIIDLTTGSVNIGINDLTKFLNGSLATEKNLILTQIRIPKMLTALIAGMTLSVCGVLMQTLFLNPLAGPYVLGINSGANLAVAIVMLGTG